MGTAWRIQEFSLVGNHGALESVSLGLYGAQEADDNSYIERDILHVF